MVKSFFSEQDGILNWCNLTSIDLLQFLESELVVQVKQLWLSHRHHRLDLSLWSILGSDLISVCLNLLLLLSSLGLLVHFFLDIVAWSACLGAAECSWCIEHSCNGNVIQVREATACGSNIGHINQIISSNIHIYYFNLQNF